MKEYMNRVDHDFNLNVFKSTDIISSCWKSQQVHFFFAILMLPEAASRSVLQKKLFLKISQNSQENICARASFLVKLQASAPFLQSTSGGCFFFSDFFDR